MNKSPEAQPAPATATATPRERTVPLLLITFVARRIGSEIQVHCRGCRELILPNDIPPSQLRGTIELDGQPVPLVDASIRSRAEGTEISHSSCIVVIERDYASQRFRVGVIVDDINEVMQLATGRLDATVETEVINHVHFANEVFKAPNPGELFSSRISRLLCSPER
jgi:chemotaxis signal transduction protein